MNKSVLGIGIIVLGALALLIINVITNYSTGGEVDYYLVKETSEAAMNDALDKSFMATNGIPRMDKQVFMESFIRRFADNVNDTREYDIGFYGLNEVPPKVSVKVDSLTVLSVKQMNDDKSEAAVISTTIDQLVETDKAHNNYLNFEYNNPNSDIGSPVAVYNGNQIVVAK